MIVLGRRENGHAIFTCEENADFSLESLLNVLKVQDGGIVFAFLDIREDKIVTITLPAQTVWELYSAGKIRVGR